MWTLLPSFPELSRLEMGLNRLDYLTAPEPPSLSTKLATLNLEGNELGSWENVMQSVAGFSQ